MRLLRLFICAMIMIASLILFFVAIYEVMYWKATAAAVIAMVSGTLALRSFTE